MTKAEIISNATRAFHKVGFKLKKHSPEILVAAGIVGTVTSAVLACKATTKLSTIMDNAKAEVDTIHHCMEHPETLPAEYTHEDGKKDLTIVYARTGVQLVKLYAPAVILGAASLACILTSHNIIRKRNIALAAAYATVDKGFKEYRGRVIERFGEELDKELKYNIKAKEIEEVVTNEDGTETVVKTTVKDLNPNPVSEYGRCFDETCAGWTKDAEKNLFFILQVQDYATKKLRERGWLSLNEVYEMLGFQASKAGQVVGWVYDEKNPIGDNYVDFGIYDLHDEQKRYFVNGYERSIWLDFNVDGNILDLIH